MQSFIYEVIRLDLKVPTKLEYLDEYLILKDKLTLSEAEELSMIVIQEARAMLKALHEDAEKEANFIKRNYQKIKDTKGAKAAEVWLSKQKVSLGNKTRAAKDFISRNAAATLKKIGTFAKTKGGKAALIGIPVATATVLGYAAYRARKKRIEKLAAVKSAE